MEDFGRVRYPKSIFNRLDNFDKSVILPVERSIHYGRSHIIIYSP